MSTFECRYRRQETSERRKEAPRGRLTVKTPYSVSQRTKRDKRRSGFVATAAAAPRSQQSANSPACMYACMVTDVMQENADADAQACGRHHKSAAPSLRIWSPFVLYLITCMLITAEMGISPIWLKC